MARWRLNLPVIIAAAVLVACAVALLAVSKKAEATFLSKNGRIAYVDFDGHDQEIYAIDPKGGRPSKPTYNDKDDTLSYSPNGERIPYSSFDGRNREIYTIRVGGGGKSRVTGTKY